MAGARLSTTCPGCGKQLSYAAEKVGRRGRCPCGVTIELRAESNQTPQIPVELAAQAAPRDGVPLAPVPIDVAPHKKFNHGDDLLDSYNWLWHRMQAVFLCSASVLPLLLGYVLITAPPEYRNVIQGILTMIGSIIPFSAGIWLWRRRKQ